MRTEIIIVFVSFLILFSFLIVYMPEELYTSGFTPQYYNLPEEFSAFDVLPKDVYMEKTLTYEGSTVYEFNDTMAIKINYCKFLNPDCITIWYSRTKWIIYIYEEISLYPWIDRNLLISNWINSNNCSVVKMNYLIECVFEDTNISRNNIGTAFDNGELNCTVYLASENENNIVGARDIIFALLSFRLPSIYSDIHPMFAILLSVLIYVPLTFIVFSVMMKIIHGD